MDKLNFYQQGAKIGLQQDKYSMAPWFIEGKNLDITGLEFTNTGKWVMKS